MSKGFSHFSYRGKSTSLVLLAGLPLVFGMILLTCFGPTKLSCSRVNADQVNCLLTRTVVFGFIKTDEIRINSLKAVRIDVQTKRATEISSNGMTAEQKVEPVYGVSLVGDENIVLDGYSPNREEQQKIVDQANIFLNDSNASNLDFQTHNYWLDTLTLMLIGSSITMLFTAFLRRKPTNQSL
jgi:hypothetical protein